MHAAHLLNYLLCPMSSLGRQCSTAVYFCVEAHFATYFEACCKSPGCDGELAHLLEQ